MVASWFMVSAEEGGVRVKSYLFCYTSHIKEYDELVIL
jgi:hypothetical protein